MALVYPLPLELHRQRSAGRLSRSPLNASLSEQASNQGRQLVSPIAHPTIPLDTRQLERLAGATRDKQTTLLLTQHNGRARPLNAISGLTTVSASGSPPGER